MLLELRTGALLAVLLIATLHCRTVVRAGSTQSVEGILNWNAKRFGHQQKAGSIPIDRYHLFNHSTAQEWLLSRAVYVFDGLGAPTAALGREPLPQVTGCGVWVSREGTPRAVLLAHASEHWLLEALGGACSGATRRGKRSGGGLCFEPLAVALPNASEDALQRLWTEGTVVASAPNPYARAARAYLRMAAGWKAGAGSECAPLPFRSYAADPVALVVQGGMFRCGAAGGGGSGSGDGSGGGGGGGGAAEEGGAGASSQPHRTYVPAMHDLALLEPLEACLTTGSGAWAVDYLIRSDAEHVLEDLRGAAGLINQRLASGSSTGEDSASGGRGGAREAAGRAGDLEVVVDEAALARHLEAAPEASRLVALYQECGDECRQGIAAFYAQDMELLGMS